MWISLNFQRKKIHEILKKFWDFYEFSRKKWYRFLSKMVMYMHPNWLRPLNILSSSTSDLEPKRRHEKCWYRFLDIFLQIILVFYWLYLFYILEFFFVFILFKYKPSKVTNKISAKHNNNAKNIVFPGNSWKFLIDFFQNFHENSQNIS